MTDTFVVTVIDKNQQGSVDRPFLVEADGQIDALDQVIKLLAKLDKRYKPQNVCRIEVQRVVSLEYMKKALAGGSY